MELEDLKNAARALAREILARVLRAGLYADRINASELSLQRNAFDSWVIGDIDRQIPEILSDVLQAMLQLDSCRTQERIIVIIGQFSASVRRLSELQTLGFRRLLHLAPTFELIRFSRVLWAQVLNFDATNEAQEAAENRNQVSGISIIPVDRVHDILLIPILRQHSSHLNQLPSPESPSSFGDYIKSAPSFVHGAAIGIPRMDAGNPLRWASIAHEVAHACVGSGAAAIKLLCNDMENALSASEQEIWKQAKASVSASGWLLECWCDLFGAVVFGPAFWRAQSIIFLTSVQQDTATSGEYPPNTFRLQLIWEIISHRFPEHVAQIVEQYYEGIISAQIIADGKRADAGFDNWLVRQVYFIFQKYFLNHFLVLDTDGSGTLTHLQESYRRMMKYWNASQQSVLTEIIKELSAGRPVPSTPSKIVDKTKPVIVQELLLANWSVGAEIEASWCDSLQELYKVAPQRLNSVLFSQLIGADDAAFSKMRSAFERYKRLDLVTLRSLQISEWVHRLPTKSDEATIKLVSDCEAASTRTAVNSGLLVDFEILNLVSSKDLKIIPMIDIALQLGSCSIDVRIGPTFEIGIPRCVQDHRDNNNGDFVFQRVDVDIGQCLRILPGQFVLGSTLEYFVFPEFLAGELEGRSSFARHGLEVHRTAGFIDNGFSGTITFELYNAGVDAIDVYPGERIAQLRFFRTNIPIRPYGKKPNAKYASHLAHIASLRKDDCEYNLQQR